jgi:Spy/CpxP family protein refolding chaperone
MRKLMISMVLCSGLLLAQGPMGRRGGPGPSGVVAERQAAGRAMAGAGALKDYLGLTDAQMEQMRTLRREQAEQVRPDAQAIRAKAQELRKEMQSSAPDAAKVGQLTVELKQLREKAMAERSGFGDKVRAVLTADQQAKLQALEEAAKLAPAARQAAAMGLITPPRVGTTEGGVPPQGPMMRGRGPGRGPARF